MILNLQAYPRMESEMRLSRVCRHEYFFRNLLTYNNSAGTSEEHCRTSAGRVGQPEWMPMTLMAALRQAAWSFGAISHEQSLGCTNSTRTPLGSESYLTTRIGLCIASIHFSYGQEAWASSTTVRLPMGLPFAVSTDFGTTNNSVGEPDTAKRRTRYVTAAGQCAHGMSASNLLRWALPTPKRRCGPHELSAAIL